VAEAADRPVHCIDMGAFESAEACAEDMRASGRAAPAVVTAFEDISVPIEPRWYPVLDYSLCVGCGKCLDFCLFGVYAREGKRVVAVQPDNCKPGCPACARICPQGAIVFPHYTDDPAIAGAPGMRVVGEEIDAEGFFGARPAPEAAPADAADGEADDDLRALADALDEFDE
jgi:NAD-dependent dihydropyrimidine dehydrogenase PreA subunit